MKLFPCLMVDGVIESVGINVTLQQVLECKCKVNPKVLERLRKKEQILPEELFEL